ncbi:MAG: aminotransferase class III-fold pyridoxal phosphate-dependent enzyme [Rhizobiales bacterium]|nr:aminotransferase class III-fold pyridoxal phosphate-dependent enzyme [Hyphomicrobiales bacterium]
MTRGSRARVAFIWPDDGLNDDEYWSYLPDGVAWLASRYPGTLEGHGLDRATFEASADLAPMITAARLTRAARPAVAALGDHAGSFIKGSGFDLVQARAIAEAAGAPHGTTPSTALGAALAHLDARRIAVVSPYDAEVTAAGLAFLEADGLAVVSLRQVAHHDEHAIAGAGAEVWRGAAVSADHPEADAIVFLGGGLRTAGMLARLEADRGKPAVPATAALVWHACRLAGVEAEKPGMGRLFDPPPGKGETGRIHGAMRRHLSSGTKTYAISETPPVFRSAAGTMLLDTDGKRYLDFACGSGTTVLGHGHPRVLAAIRTELDRGLTHLGPHFHAPVQIALMERLAGVLPSGLSAFHPATNGTEAIETALKAAVHATGRRRFLAFEGSYHGRTIGSLAVSHARGANAVLGELKPDTVHLPYPVSDGDLADLGERLDRALSTGDVAAVLVEPVQATAGMRSPHRGLLGMLAARCRSAGTLLVADEVFTGYGRTGRLFGVQWSDAIPDILVLAKAASGGVPGALVAARPEILKLLRPGVQSSTFQLHPLSAAASLATLDVLLEEGLIARALGIGERIAGSGLAARCPETALVGTAAMRGLAVFDTSGAPDQSRTRAIRSAALASGLVTWECGTHGHVIGLVPPLTVSDEEIDRALEILEGAVTRVR